MDAAAARPDADRGRSAVARRLRAVAIAQYWARDLFLNDELLDANQLHAYFRVNSIFFDPNIFGRYLALAMTALGACLAWATARAWASSLAAATFAVCLVALAFSYSISGFAALLAGLGDRRDPALGLARARRRGAIGARRARRARDRRRHADQRHRGHARRSTPATKTCSRAASTCSGQAARRLRLGAFGRAFYDEIEPGARTTVSHSEPVTVAAEQGRRSG